MDRASKKASAGTLLGAVALAVGTVLPHGVSRAATPVEGAGMFAPGSACGPAETLVGAEAANLLVRVRADAAPRRREAQGSAKPHAARKAARPRAVAPRFAERAPGGIEPEPRPAVLRSFYTCSSATEPNLAEGSGWRLVGPLRQG